MSSQRPGFSGSLALAGVVILGLVLVLLAAWRCDPFVVTFLVVCLAVAAYFVAGRCRFFQHDQPNDGPAGDTPSPNRLKRVGFSIVLALVATALVCGLRAGLPESMIPTDRKVAQLLSEVRRSQEPPGRITSILWSLPFFYQFMNTRGYEPAYDFNDKIDALGSNAVPALSAALKSDGSKVIRKFAAEALGRSGSAAAFTALLSALKVDSDEEVREAAAAALGASDDVPVSAEVITALRKDSSARVRRAAAQALSELQDSGAIPALIDASEKDRAPEVRSGAINALADFDTNSVVPVVLAALAKDSSPDVRSQAASALGNLRDERAVPALIAAVRSDTNENVRTSSINSLAYFEAKDVFPAIVAALKSDQDPGVRGAAASSLGALNSKDAIAPLSIALTNDAEPRVRSEAAGALGECDEAMAVPILLSVLETDTSKDLRSEVVRVLGRFENTNAYATLVRVLEKDPMGEIRGAAATALGRTGRYELIPALQDLLRNRSLTPEARQQAAQALQAVGGPEARAILEDVLMRERDPRVREHCATALTQLLDANTGQENAQALPDAGGASNSVAIAPAGRARQETPLVTALLAIVNAKTRRYDPYTPDDGTTSDLRRAAIQLLGRLHDERIMPVLLKILKGDGDYSARSAAAEALGCLGGRETINGLTAALKHDKEDSVRSAAAEALGHSFTAYHPGQAIAAMPGGKTSANTRAKAAVTDSETAMVPLLSTLENGEKHAASALGLIGNVKAVPTLIEMAKKGRTRDTRNEAIKALGMIGDERAIPVVRLALKDKYDDIRSSAAEALGHIGHPESVQSLKPLLTDRSSSVRFNAIFAMAEIGDQTAVQEITTQLDQKIEHARIAAATTLGLLGHAEAMPAIAKLLKSRTEWHRFAGIIALIGIDTPEAKTLLETRLHDSSYSLRTLAERVVAGEGARSLIPTLSDKGEDYRHYAGHALCFFNEPAAIPALEAACSDHNREVREAALLAIRHMRRLQGGEQKIRNSSRHT